MNSGKLNRGIVTSRLFGPHTRLYPQEELISRYLAKHNKIIYPIEISKNNLSLQIEEKKDLESKLNVDEGSILNELAGGYIIPFDTVDLKLIKSNKFNSFAQEEPKWLARPDFIFVRKEEGYLVARAIDIKNSLGIGGRNLNISQITSYNLQNLLVHSDFLENAFNMINGKIPSYKQFENDVNQKNKKNLSSKFNSKIRLANGYFLSSPKSMGVKKKTTTIDHENHKGFHKYLEFYFRKKGFKIENFEDIIFEINYSSNNLINLEMACEVKSMKKNQFYNELGWIKNRIEEFGTFHYPVFTIGDVLEKDKPIYNIRPCFNFKFIPCSEVETNSTILYKLKEKKRNLETVPLENLTKKQFSQRMKENSEYQKNSKNRLKVSMERINKRIENKMSDLGKFYRKNGHSYDKEYDRITSIKKKRDTLIEKLTNHRDKYLIEEEKKLDKELTQLRRKRKKIKQFINDFNDEFKQSKFKNTSKNYKENYLSTTYFSFDVLSKDAIQEEINSDHRSYFYFDHLLNTSFDDIYSEVNKQVRKIRFFHKNHSVSFKEFEDINQGINSLELKLKRITLKYVPKQTTLQNQLDHLKNKYKEKKRQLNAMVYVQDVEYKNLKSEMGKHLFGTDVWLKNAQKYQNKLLKDVKYEIKSQEEKLVQRKERDLKLFKQMSLFSGISKEMKILNNDNIKSPYVVYLDLNHDAVYKLQFFNVEII